METSLNPINLQENGLLFSLASLCTRGCSSVSLCFPSFFFLERELNQQFLRVLKYVCRMKYVTFFVAPVAPSYGHKTYSNKSHYFIETLSIVQRCILLLNHVGPSTIYDIESSHVYPLLPELTLYWVTVEHNLWTWLIQEVYVMFRIWLSARSPCGSK